MATESATKAVLDALAAHLKARMPSIQRVKTDFPAANEQLTLPSLTIFTQAPEFEALAPYEFSTGEIIDKKMITKYVVGTYDFELQIDLWCRDKFERHKLYDEFFNAFHAEIDPMGLSLQLENYHGIWCRYDQAGYRFDDSEASSQTGEWRVTIRLLANCRAVRERQEFIMETFETNLTTPDTIVEE